MNITNAFAGVVRSLLCWFEGFPPLLSPSAAKSHCWRQLKVSAAPTFFPYPLQYSPRSTDASFKFSPLPYSYQMWHRKPDPKAGNSSASNNSIAKSFTIRTRAAANKSNSNSLARRSRDPPQAMNVSAFLRCVIASSKEDLAAEHDGDVDDDEQSHTSDDHSECNGDEESDDNLRELLTMERVCDMLGRAQVSSEDDTEAGGRPARRRGHTTDSLEIYVFPHANGAEGSDTCDADDGSPCTGPDNWPRGAACSSFVQQVASNAGAAASGEPPAQALLKTRATLKRKVKAMRDSRMKSSVAGHMSTDEESSMTAARQRRRENQRALLRRTLSGRLLKKTSVDNLSPLNLLPHARLPKSSRIKRGKRDRSASKKEQPDTPRDHAEEVVLRKAMGSANRKYLIPRVSRIQHFNLHVVLDLDETLVSARNGPILVRPYVGHLVKMLMDLRCEIILWTAGIPQYVAGIVAGLTMAIQGLTPDVVEQERPPWIHHLIQRNSRWYNEDKVCVKDLTMLGRPMDRLLIIENNPAAVQLQVSNAVLVQDYTVENYNDRSLEVVSRIVSRCARSIEPVSVSLASDPELLFLEFDLAAEHSADGMPVRPVEYGLKYSPPGSATREHAGETPCNVIDKE